MAVPDDILKPALALKPHKEIDELWAREAESRIDGFERGSIRAVALEKVLAKYNRDDPWESAFPRSPGANQMNPSSQNPRHHRKPACQ